MKRERGSIPFHAIKFFHPLEANRQLISEHSSFRGKGGNTISDMIYSVFEIKTSLLIKNKSSVTSSTMYTVRHSLDLLCGQ